MTADVEHKKWENYEWRRASDVYGAKLSIFDQISATDIVQGFCGDCYFLSSISSLAEFPERVEKIFQTKQANEAGCYALRFYVNGEPHDVVIDDYFPWHKIKKTWAFSKSSNDGEIWVLLLEKAWAKIFGSYQRIEGGQAGEALPALTGAPAQHLDHREMTDFDKLWKTLLEFDKKKYVLATTIQSS